MTAQNKQFAVMAVIVLLLGFFGTIIASGAIERVGLEMQEIICNH